MKKICIFLLILFVTPFIFIGCNKNYNYDNLINSIVELQETSRDLTKSYITITGERRYAGNGSSTHMNSDQVTLQDVILTENSLITRNNGLSYYYLFCEITEIKYNGNAIWSKN